MENLEYYDSTTHKINIQWLPHCRDIGFINQIDSFACINKSIDSLINNFPKTLSILFISYYGYSDFSDGGDNCKVIPILSDSILIKKSFLRDEPLFYIKSSTSDSLDNAIDLSNKEFTYNVSNDSVTFKITEQFYLIDHFSSNYIGLLKGKCE